MQDRPIFSMVPRSFKLEFVVSSTNRWAQCAARRVLDQHDGAWPVGMAQTDLPQPGRWKPLAFGPDDQLDSPFQPPEEAAGL